MQQPIRGHWEEFSDFEFVQMGAMLLMQKSELIDCSLSFVFIFSKLIQGSKPCQLECEEWALGNSYITNLDTYYLLCN